MNVFHTSDGMKLAYTDEGRGPAVLCLAGLTRDHHDFDEMAAQTDGVRLIRLDYRGRGASEWETDYTNYSIAVEARDTVELLDHLRLPKAAIIGTSRGGLIAMALATMVSHRLAGVVLNDIGPELEPSGLARIMDRLGRNPDYADYGDAVARLPADRPECRDVSAARWGVEARRLWRQTENGLEIRYDPRLREAVLAGGVAPQIDTWPMFDAFAGMPLALLRGANSDLLSATTAQRMCRIHPEMIFAEVPNRGHIPFLDEPNSLSVIHEFIGRLT